MAAAPRGTSSSVSPAAPVLRVLSTFSGLTCLLGLVTGLVAAPWPGTSTSIASATRFVPRGVGEIAEVLRGLGARRSDIGGNDSGNHTRRPGFSGSAPAHPWARGASGTPGTSLPWTAVLPVAAPPGILGACRERRGSGRGLASRHGTARSARGPPVHGVAALLSPVLAPA